MGSQKGSRRIGYGNRKGRPIALNVVTKEKGLQIPIVEVGIPNGALMPFPIIGDADREEEGGAFGFLNIARDFMSNWVFSISRLKLNRRNPFLKINIKRLKNYGS